MVRSDRTYHSQQPTIEVGEEAQIEMKTVPAKCRFIATTEEGEEIECAEPTPPTKAKAKQARLNGRPHPKQLGGGTTQLLLGGPR